MKENGMVKTIFTKKYDGESLYDLNRDISEVFVSDYNPAILEIPCDEYGFQLGTFTVKIEWSNEE
jgi:hypothetical protein